MNALSITPGVVFHPILAASAGAPAEASVLGAAWDPALLVFAPLLVLSLYTTALVVHACGVMLALRPRIARIAAASGGVDVDVDVDPWSAHVARSVGAAVAAGARPWDRDAVVAGAVHECLDEFRPVFSRLAICRNLALPVAMFACAVKMILALTSIGTASIAHSSALIGASLWGTAFGVCILVAASLANSCLSISVENVDAALCAFARRCFQHGTARRAMTAAQQPPAPLPPPAGNILQDARALAPGAAAVTRSVMHGVWASTDEPAPSLVGIGMAPARAHTKVVAVGSPRRHNDHHHSGGRGATA